jgi:hypothetical protein
LFDTNINTFKLTRGERGEIAVREQVGTYLGCNGYKIFVVSIDNSIELRGVKRDGKEFQPHLSMCGNTFSVDLVKIPRR